MIHCEAIPYNAFQVNTYIVWNDRRECLVIDPAFYEPAEKEDFSNRLKERDLKLVGQLNTHCHVDHILGVNHVKKQFGFPFKAHENEAVLVEKAPTLGELFGWQLDDPEAIDEFLTEGQSIRLGEATLRCLLVPGHSPGSIAFYSPEGSFVITGDALFQGSIGRTDLPGGNYDTLMNSIQAQLLTLPDETRVFPGHGPDSTIGREKAENPFLRELL